MGKRELKKIKVPIEILPKGGDLDLHYGFTKRLVQNGIGLCPRERVQFLAGKLYFEPQNITNEENAQIFNDGIIDEQIEWEFLQMKYYREEISEKEIRRFLEFYDKNKRKSILILDKYLIQAGSSLRRLKIQDKEKANELFKKVRYFHQRRLNAVGKYPIFLDLEGYLHIYMRHVEEFQINKHFEHKDNFQWIEDDVFNVMKFVIEFVNDEYQKFKEENPDQGFNKYKKDSVYFVGDYYTFYIESSGRISSFFKNRKGQEQL